MTIKAVLTIPNHSDVLRKKSTPVKRINENTKELIADLLDTFNDPPMPAAGLSAPQIGVHKRVFVVGLGENYEPIIMINPQILKSSGKKKDFDGCLSVPNVFANTTRAFSIRVKYLDQFGRKKAIRLKDMSARTVLHEIDHLNGILFTDLIESVDDYLVLVDTPDGPRLAPIHVAAALQREKESPKYLRSILSESIDFDYRLG
jgi:peptide deformylase